MQDATFCANDYSGGQKGHKDAHHLFNTIRINLICCESICLADAELTLLLYIKWTPRLYDGNNKYQDRQNYDVFLSTSRNITRVRLTKI